MNVNDIVDIILPEILEQDAVEAATREIRPADEHCNAWDYRKQEYCKHIAGYSTPREGIFGSRCRFHGGMTPQRGTSIVKNNYAPAQLRKVVEDLKEDSDVMDLRNEIAIARAAISVLDINEVDQRITLNSLLNTVAKLVERLHTIEVSRRYLVPADDVEKQMRVIGNIILEFITDPQTRAQVADRIESAMTITLPNRK